MVDGERSGEKGREERGRRRKGGRGKAGRQEGAWSHNPYSDTSVPILRGDLLRTRFGYAMQACQFEDVSHYLSTQPRTQATWEEKWPGYKATINSASYPGHVGGGRSGLGTRLLSTQPRAQAMWEEGKVACVRGYYQLSLWTSKQLKARKAVPYRQAPHQLVLEYALFFCFLI